jgi:membrane-bound metal-dependent hydrolase YbcI (DUF457 family)
MNKTGHFIGGVLTSIAVTYITKQPNIITIGGIMLGCFLPDLDANHSYIDSKMIINPVYILNKVLPKNRFTSHRGVLFHSIWTIIILVGIMQYYKFSWILGIILGVLSHHVLDMFTAHRLPNYFYPIKL